jgi:cell division ATPase FtsA|tara:strand:+ start:1558 stop:2262 length:705 start_codon:yes stop_codon:yes gene_type:complete
MIEEIDFETFLHVSNNKYRIFVFDKNNLKNLYSEEIEIYNESNFPDLSNLSKFLDKNIYKIEKLVGNFIKNIILIIEDDKTLQVNIGIKKKNYDNSINQKYLENNLIELKDLFKENYQERTIMHMIVINYIVNGNKYTSFKSNLISDNLCIEVNFISISNELIISLDKILEKYQIKINQYMCGNYIKNFFDKDNSEISLMAYKLKNGYNDNEAILIPKNIENKGFFEKFFQLFS